MMIRQCCVLDESDVKCTNDCVGNSKHCKEHIGQCCAKGENNTRCKNDCVGESRHCLEHITKSKKLYLNYKCLSEYVKTIDVNKPFDDINEQINYLLKYYDVLHKTYSARTKHRQYAIAPECYDVGHNRQFIILEKKINYCEKLLGDFNVNIDNIQKPNNINKPNVFDRFKRYKTQFFNPREKLNVSNIVRNNYTFNKHTYIIKNKNDTNQIINDTNQIINDTKNVINDINQIMNDPKEINNILMQPKNNIKVAKIKNKSLKTAMRKIKLIGKTKDTVQEKPIKKKKNKKKFEPILQMNQITIKKDIVKEESIEEYEEYEDEEFDEEELEYYTQLIEEKLRLLISQMYKLNASNNEFILFVGAIKLINKLTNDEVNYLIPKYRPLRKKCGCFRYYEMLIFCKCSCMDGIETINDYCSAKYNYSDLKHFYDILNRYSDKITPLLEDIKKLYSVFDDGIIDLPIILIWSASKNRLVIEQKGYSPNQHIH